MGLPSLTVPGARDRSGLAVTVDRISLAFKAQVVLDDLSLAIAESESVALMGPSGSGKTSLLNCITGVRVPDAGRVLLGDFNMCSMSDSDRAALRRTEMGLVFQVPDLLPELSVGENVAITRIFDGESRKTAAAAAVASLSEVGLVGYADRAVDELSGGEAQRVAVARALCRSQVRLIVADEPTASLDRANADLVSNLLLERTRTRGITLILATHDPKVAEKCDRIIEVQIATMAGAKA